jgi:endonuclease YncB( thermonuclease family)
VFRLLVIVGLAWGFAGFAHAAKKWRAKENCAFLPDEPYDGDSFHAKWNTRHYILRLYFVDAPETDASVPERVREQADYWGIDEQAAMQVGKEARKFTAEFLKNGFTAYTKLQDARGRSDRDRDYAIVRVGERDLGEELVRAGLARVFGMGMDLPDDTPEKTAWWRLRSAENAARQQRRGAWACTADARVPAPGLRPDLAGRTIVTARSITVYAGDDPSRQLGILRAGATVTVVKADSPAYATIRFTVAPSRTVEGLCRQTDLAP